MTRVERKRSLVRFGALALVAAAVALLWVVESRPRSAPPPVAAATVEDADGPDRGPECPVFRPSRHPDVPAPAARVAAPPSRSRLVNAPPMATEIRVGGEELPAPARQTGSAWVTAFRDAVCACKTRACVRDLQAGFLHQLEGAAFDEARDSRTYTEQARAAIRCYAALPEGS